MRILGLLLCGFGWHAKRWLVSNDSEYSTVTFACNRHCGWQAGPTALQQGDLAKLNPADGFVTDHG